MFELDLKSRLPIYEQLVEKMKHLMILGILSENEQLPSVRQLSHDLSINPNTIQKAYRELEQQGLIYSLPGKGSFVAAQHIQNNDRRLTDILEQIQNLTAEAIFLGMSQETIIENIEAVFKQSKGGQKDAAHQIIK